MTLPVFLLTALLTNSGWTGVRQALDDGLPTLALARIDSLPPAGNPADLLTHARALLAAHRPADAVRLLGESCVPDAPEVLFWLAQAQAAEGDWEPALKNYRASALASGSPEAGLGAARMLRNLNRSGESGAELEALKLRFPADETVRIDLARLRIAENRFQDALDLLQSMGHETIQREDILLLAAQCEEGLERQDAVLSRLADFRPATAEQAVQATLLKARAQRATGESQAAENTLEDFLANNPHLENLSPLFALLEEIQNASASPTTSELRRWAMDTRSGPRRRLAMWHLARAEAVRGSPAAALPFLEALVAEPGSDPSPDEAARELAALRIRTGTPAQAAALLPEASFEGRFLRGLAAAKAGDFGSARSHFLGASEDPALAEAALFNAALSELLSGNPGDSAMKLAARFPDSPLAGNFRLQEACFLARNGDPAARRKFEELSASTNPVLAAQAALGLAEWQYWQLDFPSARAGLQRVSTASAPSHPAVLEVFLADDGTPGSMDRALEKAKAARSLALPSDLEQALLMKTGEILYRRGDFVEARETLVDLARKHPDAACEKPALYLAAQSAARIPSTQSAEEALLLLEEVASKPGPLAERARIEQAALLSARNNPVEANLLLEKVLASTSDPAIRAEALMEKGKNFHLLGEADPANYQVAVATWNAIAADPAADPAMRAQAFSRIGVAQEKAGNPAAAVEAFFEVLRPRSSGVAADPFWFYKSGFAAGRLLEAQSKWDEAIRTYEILAGADGPRASEARSRIEKIRLEKFLWEATPPAPGRSKPGGSRN